MAKKQLIVEISKIQFINQYTEYIVNAIERKTSKHNYPAKNFFGGGWFESTTHAAYSLFAIYTRIGFDFLPTQRRAIRLAPDRSRLMLSIHAISRLGKCFGRRIRLNFFGLSLFLRVGKFFDNLATPKKLIYAMPHGYSWAQLLTWKCWIR